MKEYMEFSAKTVDEAITKALLELETSSDRLEYEVVEKGASGFLGMFSKPAVIRVAKKTEEEDDLLFDAPVTEKKAEQKTEPKQEKKEEKKEEKPGRTESSIKTEKPEKAETPAREEKQTEKKPARPENAKPAAKPQSAGQERTSLNHTDSGKEEGAPDKAESSVREGAARKDREQPNRNNNNRNRNNRDRSQNAGGQNRGGNRNDHRSNGGYGKSGRDRGYEKNYDREAKAAVPTPMPEKQPVLIREPADENIRALMKKAEEFLAGVVRNMGLAAQFETLYDEEDKTICISLEGENMGILIGKRGQTLDSLQYLTSLVVNKGQEEYIRVKLDTENYRARRKETLENLARNISYKVRRTKRPVSLEPMNPYERRIIHAALQNDRYVVTRSEGVEPYRYVVISPKNGRYSGKDGKEGANRDGKDAKESKDARK